MEWFLESTTYMAKTHCKNGHEFTVENTKLLMNRTKGTTQRRCKQCHNAYFKKRMAGIRKQDPEAHRQMYREWQTKAKYGITWADKQALLLAQGYKCGNSGCPNTEAGGQWNEWHIDHNHTTGKVRGLLCHSCNTALGLLGENNDRILGLLNYIKGHNGSIEHNHTSPNNGME